jgi:hypothetical protein
VTIEDSLVAAIAQFLSVMRTRPSLLCGQSGRDFAETLADLPEAEDIRQLAAVAAQKNGYLMDKRTPEGKTPRHSHTETMTTQSKAGRDFNASALYRLGIASLLLTDYDFDRFSVARRVAGYLSGPAVPLSSYVILDLDWDFPGPLHITGWKLWKPKLDDFKDVLPVPIAVHHLGEPAWDPLLYAGAYVVLSTEKNDEAATVDRRLWLFMPPVPAHAWKPLLLLNLWQDTGVNAVAEYLVEPSRNVERRRGHIPRQPLTENGEVDIPMLGPLCISGSDSPRYAHFISALSAEFDAWKSPSNSAERKSLERLRRGALRFLETGPTVGFDADVTMPYDRAGVVLSYVSALENILSGAAESSGDLRRRTAQRAAALIGGDDDSRVAVHDHVYEAYGLRNKIAHGDEVGGVQLTAAAKSMRGILRNVFVAAIMLGPSGRLDVLCDNGLLSHSFLRKNVRAPIDKFWDSCR